MERIEERIRKNERFSLFLFLSSPSLEVLNAEGALRAYYVDAGNHFVIDHLSPGEYELRLIIKGNQPGTLMMSPQMVMKVMEFRQKVVVGTNNQPPVTMTIDLGWEGSNQ